MTKRQRKKKVQKDPFEGTKNSRPPIFIDKGTKRQNESTPSTESHIVKRPRTSGLTGEQLMNSFYQSMRDNILQKVTPMLGKTNQLNKMKDKMVKAKQLPPGVLTNTEAICDSAQGEVARHLEAFGTKRKFIYWQDYVNDNFDNIVEMAKAPSSSAQEPLQIEGMSSQSDVEGLSDLEIRSERSPSETPTIQSETTNISQTVSEVLPPNNTYRTHSVSLQSIIRKDVDPEVRTVFLEKLQGALYSTTYYIMDFQLIVFSLMLSMKSMKFTKNQNGTIDFSPCEGFEINKILPTGFSPRFDLKFSAPPISADLVNSESVCDDFRSLFQEHHLDRINIICFSKRKQRVASPPLHELLIQSNKELISTLVQINDIKPPSQIMISAFTEYKTNMKNMWAENRIMNKTLAKLLDVLLKLHLAPKREELYHNFISQKKNRKSKKNGFRNSFHNSIRSEKRKLRKCEKKAREEQGQGKWTEREKTCKSRLNKMYNDFKDNRNSVSATEKDDETPEDTISDSTNDISRRRLGVLKSVIRKLLFKFHGQSITEDNFKEELDDVTDIEAGACLTIANSLMPYIPSKVNYKAIGFQLPFLSLANDILKCAGYSKSILDLCPKSSHSSLHSLRLDAPSLYALCSMKSIPNQMAMFDFDGYIIDSIEKARTYKDAVFNSFFDIRAITKACQSKKLNFAHNITVMPGLKSVRILGTKNVPQKTIEHLPNNYRHLKDLPWDVIQEYQRKPDGVLKSEIADLDIEIKDLMKQVKSKSKIFSDQDFSGKIKELKKQWKNDHSQYNNIQELKVVRYESFRKIETMKQQLATKRSTQYQLRKAIEFRGKVLPNANTDTNIAQQGLSQQLLDQYIFSGTDNGLKTMTETVAMDINKFRYHLDLHNRFSPLAPSMYSNADSSSGLPSTFQAIPESLKITAQDVDFGSGNFRRRRTYERDKRETEEGKEVQKIEDELSKSSVFLSNSVNDVLRRTQGRKENVKKLRIFYHSKKRVSIDTSVELGSKRFKDRLASRERSFCGATRPQYRVVMFIGDRGLGIGSTLKGHLKYGGKWKTKRHAATTKVIITNEHKTSQTCLYCFHSITHPQRVITSDNKTIRKTINGAFVCLNPECISVKTHQATQSRDKSSALAIAISGLSVLLFDKPLPVFNPKVSQPYTDIFKKTSTFCTRNEERDDSGAV